MLSIYAYKHRFQRLLRPLTVGLARAGVTANQVTVAAVVLSAAGGGAIALAPAARWPLLLLPAVLLVRMGLNAIDGMLAREHGMKSRRGAVLNELGDVVADAALYLPLALVPGVPAALVVAVVVAGTWTEMAGVVVQTLGASRRYEGPMGKSDRAFAFGAIALALALGASPGTWLAALLALVLVLTLWTVANRARRGLAEAPAGDAA